MYYEIDIDDKVYTLFSIFPYLYSHHLPLLECTIHLLSIHQVVQCISRNTFQIYKWHYLIYV